MRFTVASLDVIGNEIDGWEVNDQNQIGSIDVDRDAAEDDQVLINVLNQNQYLDNVSLDDDVLVYGDDLSYLTVVDAESERPILALILQQ